MSSQVKICLCPFEPNIANAEGLIISVSAPYSEDEVTVTINPNITDYVEGQNDENINVAQLMRYSSSDETITTKLDLVQNPEQRFAYGGKLRSIRFMGTSKELHEGQEFLSFEFFVDELELTGFQNEGSVAFTLNHEHSDWLTNGNAYKFNPVREQGVFIQASKESDCTFRVSINGPLGHSLTFRHDLSELTTTKLHVALEWKDSAVKLYLNGNLVNEQKIEE